MEDFLRKGRDTDDLHKNPPDFRKLEIKGKWSGNVHEPVNLRISLEVNQRDPCLGVVAVVVA